MRRRIDVCADDYGLAPALCASIAALAARGRLSSISCLVNAPHWAAEAPRLVPLVGRTGLGLHFNLTEGVPLAPELRRVWPRLPTLPRLMARAQLRRLPLEAIDAEWRAQLDAFTRALGRTPEHVDGHQHVHHLPGVRDIVLDGVAAIAPLPGVRNTGRVLGPGFAWKRRLIERSGGRALAHALQARAQPSSTALLGCYDFAATDYRRLVRRWLRRAPAGALLFCHPGPALAGDAIAAARAREYAYLASDAFERDLGDAGVELGAVWRRL